MRSHKQGVILAGKIRKEPRAKFVEDEKGTVALLHRDFMERMGVNANNQMQFEYFNKDVSLGSEGVIVYLHQPGTNIFETIFYAMLSTEKKQDGRIVYANTQMVLKMIEDDMVKAKAKGATVAAIDTVIDNSDGCAVQYRCGTSLFMNWKLSMESKKVYHKNIDEPGHGKSTIDSENAPNKTQLSKGLCGNVTSQPEAYVEGKNTNIYVDIHRS